MAEATSVLRHIAPAAIDVGFVAALSLAPLLLARLAPKIVPNAKLPEEPYFSFLTNGQLSIYSIGSIAAILLLIFRKRLPERTSLWVGFITLATLVFLIFMIALDPKLENAPQTFVGPASLAIYVGVLLIRIWVDALRKMDPPDIETAGAASATDLTNRLKNRMKEKGK